MRMHPREPFDVHPFRKAFGRCSLRFCYQCGREQEDAIHSVSGGSVHALMPDKPSRYSRPQTTRTDESVAQLPHSTHYSHMNVGIGTIEITKRLLEPSIP
jgi:hypothetical protein